MMAIITQPCPFCGCDEKDLTLSSEKSISCVWHFVLCGNCSAQGPQEKSAGEAWERWNDRI
ncbi:Lar family restriction alleviation protein [uncultured Paraglaciecola sp.]|uniref:Lar family restriction alleviation protein n=1 Tax=uncultured Paraglaciecola sp. TaxID=1765024 RepID=UPI00345BB9B4